MSQGRSGVCLRLMKGYLCLQFLQSSPSPSQSKNSSSPASMSLSAQKAILYLPSEKMFSDRRLSLPWSAWLMKRDWLPMNLASIVPSGLPKLQNELSMLRLSRSRSTLWSISSPLQIITSSSFPTFSAANSPSPASPTVDRPTLTRLNCPRSIWLLRHFLSDLSRKQRRQRRGSHSILLTQQGHRLLRQSSFLQLQPLRLRAQVLGQRHCGRQKPLVRHWQLSQLRSQGSSPTKQWQQADTMVGCSAWAILRRRLVFLGGSGTLAASSCVSLSSMSASEGASLMWSLLARWYSSMRKRKTREQEMGVPWGFSPVSRFQMSQGEQECISIPSTISPRTTGESSRILSDCTFAHSAGFSILQHSGEQGLSGRAVGRWRTSIWWACSSEMASSSCLRGGWMLVGLRYWNCLSGSCSSWPCCPQSYSRQMVQKRVFMVLGSVTWLSSSPASMETATCVSIPPLACPTYLPAAHTLSKNTCFRHPPPCSLCSRSSTGVPLFFSSRQSSTARRESMPQRYFCRQESQPASTLPSSLQRFMNSDSSRSSSRRSLLRPASCSCRRQGKVQVSSSSNLLCTCSGMQEEQQEWLEVVAIRSSTSPRPFATSRSSPSSASLRCSSTAGEGGGRWRGRLARQSFLRRSVCQLDLRGGGRCGAVIQRIIMASCRLTSVYRRPLCSFFKPLQHPSSVPNHHDVAVHLADCVPAIGVSSQPVALQPVDGLILEQEHLPQVPPHSPRNAVQVHLLVGNAAFAAGEDGQHTGQQDLVVGDGEYDCVASLGLAPADEHHAALVAFEFHFGDLLVGELGEDDDGALVGAEGHLAALLIEGVAVDVPPLVGTDLQSALAHVPQAEGVVVAEQQLPTVARQRETAAAARDPHHLLDLAARARAVEAHRVVREVDHRETLAARQTRSPRVGQPRDSRTHVREQQIHDLHLLAAHQHCPLQLVPQVDLLDADPDLQAAHLLTNLLH